MKTAVLAVLIIVSASLFAAAKDKGGIGPQTDFKSMPAEQVLTSLQSAGSLKVDASGTSFAGDRKDPDIAPAIKHCNGGKADNNYSEGEIPCKQIFLHHVERALSGQLGSADTFYIISALLRGCGFYAIATDKDYTDGGITCGYLGKFLYSLGNVEAAKTVWERAPGCYSIDHRAGTPTNGCVNSMLGYGDRIGSALSVADRRRLDPYNAYKSEPERLLGALSQSCNTIHDRDSCEFLQTKGIAVDMAAVVEAENEFRGGVNENRERVQGKLEQAREQSEARRNALFGALQSLPGGNDPNAVLNAGNRQAAAMRRIGDARANQPPVAAANTILPLATTAANSSGAAVSQSALGQNGNEQGSSEISGGSGSTGFTGTSGAVYANPLASTCVSTFWDPKYYNWLSFQNNCGQAIYLSFIFNSGKYGFSAMNLASGAAGNTGQSQNEVNAQGGYRVAVCPSGYFPVDSSTGQAITQPNQNFRCKKQ